MSEELEKKTHEKNIQVLLFFAEKLVAIIIIVLIWEQIKEPFLLPIFGGMTLYFIVKLVITNFLKFHYNLDLNYFLLFSTFFLGLWCYHWLIISLPLPIIDYWWLPFLFFVPFVLKVPFLTVELDLVYYFPKDLRDIVTTLIRYIGIPFFVFYAIFYIVLHPMQMAALFKEKGKRKAEITHNILGRIVLAVCVADDDIHEKEVQAIKMIFKENFNRELDSEYIKTRAAGVMKNRLNMSDVALLDEYGVIDNSMKPLIIKSAYLVANADGTIHEKEAKILMLIGKALKMSKDEIQALTN